MAVGDGTVFINYRRDDTRWPAKTIYEELTRRIGPERVFKDVDNIELGENFVERITAAVTRCDVMLSLIGEDWLDSADSMGRRRLDNPRDFVRLELETALQRGVRVIPILVDGAEMPAADSLPESLRPLTERQAVSISPERVEIDRLVKALTASFADSARPLVMPPAGPAAAPTTPPPYQAPGSSGSPYQAPGPSGSPYQAPGPSGSPYQAAQFPSGPSYQQPAPVPPVQRPAPGYPQGQPTPPQIRQPERQGPNRTPWLLAAGVIVVALIAWGLNSVLNPSTDGPTPTPRPASPTPSAEPTTPASSPAASPQGPPVSGIWTADDVSRFLFTRAELEAMVPDATGIFEDELSWVWTDTTASPDYCSGAIAFGPDGGVDRWRKAVASSPSGAVVSFGAAYDTAALAAVAFDRLRATRCDGEPIELTSSGQPWDTISYSEVASEFGYSLTRIDFTFGSWRERACVTNRNVLVCYSMAATAADFATADGTGALTLGVDRARGLVPE